MLYYDVWQVLHAAHRQLLLAPIRPLPGSAANLACSTLPCLPAQPHFREQFEISQPTARYSGLLGMLPEVMVAPAARLEPLVTVLCSEMSLAFEQHGLSLPPWRQSKSLLSK